MQAGTQVVHAISTFVTINSCHVRGNSCELREHVWKKSITLRMTLDPLWISQNIALQHGWQCYKSYWIINCIFEMILACCLLWCDRHFEKNMWENMLRHAVCTIVAGGDSDGSLGMGRELWLGGYILGWFVYLNVTHLVISMIHTQPQVRLSIERGRIRIGH